MTYLLYQVCYQDLYSSGVGVGALMYRFPRNVHTNSITRTLPPPPIGPNRLLGEYLFAV